MFGSGSTANDLDVPKTRHSVRKVALPDGVGADIAGVERIFRLSVEPEAWVFPSETLKSPLNRDNVGGGPFYPKLKETGSGG